jgi:hypothetical protein
VKRSLLLAAALAALVPRALAQGDLSSQGYGYPAGPLSTRALATGGAVGELDPVTTLNPAALTTWGRSGLYGQFGPEWRSLDAGGTTSGSTLIRFPLFVGALSATDRLMFGLSFTNFLDRTWGTQTSGYYPSGSDSVAYSQTFTSGGAITNVRLAAGYRISNSLRIGVGGHLYTGQQTLSISEIFADTNFASFFQVSRVNVTGGGLSAGVAWSPIPTIAFGASGMIGSVMTARRNDSVVASARVPARAGVTALYAGVNGVVLAADVEWTQWSAMNGLASSPILAVDSWDYGVGAEIKLPTANGVDIPLRIGYRQRTLPFQADSATVKETAFSGGVGVPLSGGKARLDIGVIRSLRRADLPQPVKENAWTVSIGILVRP